MNSTTPKAGGINYAKLRKQKSKDTIPQAKYEILMQHQGHGILKHRSTSQHNIQSQQMNQIQLFDQYFNSSKIEHQDGDFLDFVDKQIQYHSSPVQPLQYIFRTQHKKWEEEKKKLLLELQRMQQENQKLNIENNDLRRSKSQLIKQVEQQATLLALEQTKRYTNQPLAKFHDFIRNMQKPIQETVSSLTDERFESNETILESELSNDEDSDAHFMDLYSKQRKKYYQFAK